MSKTSIKTLNTRMLLHRTKLSKKDSKSKPFGFCCSLDHFDPLSRYNQRRPPYESSLMAITSVHECPVSKMQVKFLTSRLTREKKRLKGSEVRNQQRSKSRKLNYSRFDKSDRSIKWYLEDEIALAKDMFWIEKQRIHNEMSIKAVSIGKKKFKKEQKTLLSLCPRWYQDFSLNQMRNLMNLENVMRADYEETKTDGTQRILIAIGVISTFFKLKPNIITKLYKSCNLNSVDFLREIYKILTGNDFYKEEYKKFYDCNERIILSAIAFLTLPEALEELHKRLPAMIVPKLPSKPKPPVCLARQKNSCPYEEELFKCSDWASYRNALQKWQKRYKLLRTIPKITLPCFKQQKFLINDGLLSEIRKQEKNIYINHFEKSNTKDLQKSFSTKFDTKDKVNSDEVTYEDKAFPKQENLKSTDKSTSNIYCVLDNGKKSDSTISNPKPRTMEHKIYDALKPPANPKSWLGEKAYYTIKNASLQDDIVTCENISVINMPPSSSDEKFFAMLKLDDRPKKIFPSGRENLSRNWQDWLQNADEDFKQVEEEADELMKSTQTIMKLVFPGLVCDNCCLCRQTRKIEELQSKASNDNTMQNSEFVAESMLMHSPDSVAKLPINLTASQKEIETNFIISGVTEKNDQILYNISDDQSENISSRIPDPPLPKLKNVPPCSCAIQQMINKKVSPSLSEDDIPWIKDEELCMGKKYRPDEACTYSCETYPADRSCRRNPFMKEIIRMERDKREKKIKEEEKENAELIENIKKEIQTSTKNMVEKNKFISDYPYDNPWNILRTAPSNITKTDYEKTLKLTPPAMPTISSSSQMQERQNFPLQELNKIEKDILHNKSNEEISKISKSSKKIKGNRGKDRQSNRVDRLHKYDSIKKNKKNVMDEAKQLNNRKQEITKKNIKPFAILNDIQPAILPEKSLTTGHNPEEIIVESSVDEEKSHAISNNNQESYGWRTKSEQELPAKKTLAYLCEPDYPLETVAVRPGGRPCQCRENRSKKKIPVYNVVDLMEERDGKMKMENRITNGVFYVTPSVSPRRSDEYIPEYELAESPYDMCTNQITDERLKLIERYSGPKSLLKNIQKKSKSCSCSNGFRKEKHLVDEKKNIAEIRQKLMESKVPEERWKAALKDAALMDYFTQRKNNVPCWISCKKFAQNTRPHRLKVVKPVCECKYERKIVEQKEQRTKWKEHQEKLKALKKQPFMHIVDGSRPMTEDTKFIILDVEAMREDEHKEDIKYCIEDVAKDVSMSSPQLIIDDVEMLTRFQTSKPSKEDIPQAVAPHRHWSPINIPPGPLPRRKEEMEHRKKAKDEAFRFIYGDNNEQERDASYLNPNYQESDKKKLVTSYETKESYVDMEKKMSKRTAELQSPSKIEQYNDVSHTKIAGEIFEEKKYLEEVIDEIAQQNVSYKQIIDKMDEKIDDEMHPINNDEKQTDMKYMAIIKAELKKMAAEGYVFAKLPKCYLMPQLRDWIMYRQSVTFSETDKQNLMQTTIDMWQLLETMKTPKIKRLSLPMTERQLKRLTYNQAKEIKEKIQEVKTIFHSKVRKARVSYAHTMWNTMEFGKFPSTSFKRAFFTYMASKEADGHVYKQWLPSEVHRADPEFSCY